VIAAGRFSRVLRHLIGGAGKGKDGTRHDDHARNCALTPP
jgi:hypothetical protein